MGEPAPARGTRPRNRRQQIMGAAAELFARDGYAHVSMSDLADAVAVRPSALYRHFRGKEELLHHVVLDALSAIRQALDQAPDIAVALAHVVLDHRQAGALWQREARHLPPELRTDLRDEIRKIQHDIARVVTTQRPELPEFSAGLLAWAAMCSMMSVSFQRIELPRAEYEQLLAAIVDDVLQAPLDHAAEPPLPQPAPVPPTRRDELATAAARLFAENGYRTVGIDDVGAAAGITGPSVYKHFDSKLDLLVTIVLSGAEKLSQAGAAVLDHARSDEEALTGLVRSYTEFSFAHNEVMDLLIAETAHLPDRERKIVVDAQRSYLANWARLLGRTRPDLSAAHARVRVQAAVSLTNDIARTPALRAHPETPAVVTAVGRAILERPTS
ncbi:TetR/AcrR family transcriptional regulator [Amycolatopsis jejuensis]|uniref:TetR/AcrR family transcriptional regulator n=1 Tax=Amycolatopsis jejuensis TaxID=330084 RepID=UPI00068F756D|nr:TetR/AcrR family transcriptional regulator [Amycolatopsis jejuensis]